MTMTTTITTTMTKLSSVMLISLLLVLSYIATAQLRLDITSSNNNAAFAEPNHDPSHEPCTSTVTDGIEETTCSGGFLITTPEGRPSGAAAGHSTCTIDTSTFIGSCTGSGGEGIDGDGGAGGRSICTVDTSGGDDREEAPPTDEEPNCSFDVGGGSLSKAN